MRMPSSLHFWKGLVNDNEYLVPDPLADYFLARLNFLAGEEKLVPQR